MNDAYRRAAIEAAMRRRLRGDAARERVQAAAAAAENWEAVCRKCKQPLGPTTLEALKAHKCDG